jgi:hypothetical protein
MTTINEMYGPLVEAARNNAPDGHEILRRVADKICRANPRCYASIEDGIEVAKQNLQCFLQFYPEHVSDQARVYYGLVKTQ